ncbi:transmembrane protein 87A-like isoform X1 [Leptotrombidium deliense]|uniref:Transmembrane protein 87A-like isoform X1 n=1 Tax=Leptotrombidium deliense TaxID=299467 RepID=A0A443SMG1_9ACAR|nr:transmembrane protein 87A-like isoform X1 [Leptotrombidium deliense]
MAKKKSTRKKRDVKEYETVLSSDEEQFDETDARAKDKFSDSDSDIFSEEENANKNLLKKDKLSLNNEDYDEMMSEVSLSIVEYCTIFYLKDEVMAFSSDDSDDSEQDPLTSYYQVKAKKDEMGSDLDEEEEKDIPSAEAWGKKKRTYYSTDYVDKDYRKYTQQDEEAALAEEQEALQAQKRLLDEINDADIGFEVYEKEPEESEETKSLQEHQKLEVDLSSMKTQEKRKLFQRTCPEISPLIDNFNIYLEEVRDIIEPILKMGKNQKYKVMTNSLGFKFLEAKYALLMRYALNISFYMALKCNQVDTKNHPITKTLFTYNKLLSELEKAGKSSQLHKEINEIFACLKRNEEISFSDTNDVKQEKIELIQKSEPRSLDFVASNPKAIKKVTFAADEEEDDDDEELEGLNGEWNIPEDDGESFDDEMDNVEESSKRAITYQIAKNKGLTPKKKKELRNPRVKHRTKFKKALVRRKGQVRQPRKELHKYSGEMSGIRSSVIKSQECNYFQVHKALYKDSVISINVVCSASTESLQPTYIKLGWVIRDSPCFEEYLGPEISLVDYLKWYYSCPVILLGDFGYSEVRYLKTEEIQVKCDSFVDQKLTKVLDTFSVGRIGNSSTCSPNPSLNSKKCGSSPPPPASLFGSNFEKMQNLLDEKSVTNKRRKRSSHDGKPVDVSNASRTIISPEGIKTSDHQVKIPYDGVYLLVLYIEGINGVKFSAKVDIEMKGKLGYLSAVEWPLLPFYGVMCIVYVIFAIGWLIVSALQWRDLLRIQFWVGAVIFLGMIEKAVFYAEYQSINSTGQSVQGAVLFAELLSCLKRTLARMLVIIVSLGFGIVKPRLGPMLHRVVCVGGLYFILSAIEAILRVYKPKNDPTNQTLMAGIPLAVLDSIICWWIFSSLVQTTRTLRLRRNLVKLNLYRQFANTLIFAVLGMIAEFTIITQIDCFKASIVFMVWVIHYHKLTSCLTDWKELWCDDAYWHLLFSVVLLVIMVLWRPTNNNQRYAFTPLLDASDDEGELSDHLPVNDAFDGMKMRQQRNCVNSNYTSHGVKEALLSKEAEEDLKWIEDNIPTSFVDAALPALVDSDEELMTTKLEQNKME